MNTEEHYCHVCQKLIPFFEWITKGKRDGRFCRQCWAKKEDQQRQEQERADLLRQQKEEEKRKHAFELRQRHLFLIRQGRLPLVQKHGLELQAGELCHLSVHATYERKLKHETRFLRGLLVATDKRLYFLTAEKSHTILWSNIMQVTQHLQGISLSLAKGVGAGFYSVVDPEMVAAILDTEVKIAKRQLLPAEGKRVVLPQEVRNAVWQRDKGRCVECGASGKGVELQFDHIIPWSKGGASTFENIQLLCSLCNKKKGSRI